MSKKTKMTVPENLDAYATLVTSVPGIEVKGATMPYTSVNGNMFSFLKEGRAALRLPQEAREQFLMKYGTALFEAHGIIMKEYVTISGDLIKNAKDLRPYVKKSYEYAQTLKPKPTKKK